MSYLSLLKSFFSSFYISYILSCVKISFLYLKNTLSCHFYFIYEAYQYIEFFRGRKLGYFGCGCRKTYHCFRFIDSVTNKFTVGIQRGKKNETHILVNMLQKRYKMYHSVEKCVLFSYSVKKYSRFAFYLSKLINNKNCTLLLFDDYQVQNIL